MTSELMHDKDFEIQEVNRVEKVSRCISDRAMEREQGCDLQSALGSFQRDSRNLTTDQEPDKLLGSQSLSSSTVKPMAESAPQKCITSSHLMTN